HLELVSLQPARFLSLLTNGPSLDGSLCHLRDERYAPRRFGHVGGMGTTADLYDYDRDPRGSFHRRVAVRIAFCKVVVEHRHRRSNDCYRATRSQQSLVLLCIATEDETLAVRNPSKAEHGTLLQASLRSCFLPVLVVRCLALLS